METVFAFQDPRGSTAGAGFAPTCCVSLAYHGMSSFFHMNVVCSARIRRALGSDFGRAAGPG